MDAVLTVLTGYSPWQKLALLGVIFVVLVVLTYRANYVIQYPQDLPRIGQDKKISWSQMRQKFLTNCLEVCSDAYDNYSKKGRSVLIPVFGPHDEVILPPSAVQWLCKQPDEAVSSLAAQLDAIQLAHSLGGKFANDPWGGVMIKTDLNAALETVCSVMNDELRAALDATFGTDTEEWKEVDLFPACRIIGGRATLRFTLGDSEEGRKLCRDESFVDCCYGVLDGMLDTAGAMATTRKAFRPFLGPWASRKMPAKLKDLQGRFEPLWRERCRMLEKEAESGKDGDMPQDLIQMMLRYAAKHRQKELQNLGDITKRLAVSNFGTMHQSIITLHNLLLNVVGSDAQFNTISVLRDEFNKLLGEGDPTDKRWTRAQVASMTKADSICRETLRVNSFIGRTVQRLVLAPNGVVTPDGIRLPKGTMVSILAHHSQTDGDRHDDPLSYDPFRFSRQREAAADKTTGKAGLNNLSFVSTSSDYLPWSHGRHACPGRFLVDFELKMILAYVVMNYELEFPESYEGKRPPNNWFAGFGIPPLEAKMRVKRRKL